MCLFHCDIFIFLVSVRLLMQTAILSLSIVISLWVPGQHYIHFKGYKEKQTKTNIGKY